MNSSLESLLELNQLNVSKLEILLKKFCLEYDFKTCLITKREEGTSFFEDFILLGYNEVDFFYSFLAQGRKEKEDLLNSSIPLIFSGENYNLFLGKNSKAIVQRIYDYPPLGFILFESEKGINSEQELAVTILAEKICRLMDLAEMNLPLSNSENESSQENEIEGIFDIIFEKSSGVENSLIANRFLFLQGSRGTGKKSFLEEYGNKCKIEITFSLRLHPKDDTEEKIIRTLNLLDSSNSVRVVEEVENSSKVQQEILYNILLKPIHEPKIFFITEHYKIKEEYKPFWDLLKMHTIKFPDIIEISFTKLKQIIDILFVHYKKILNKQNLQIQTEVYEYLFNIQYKENLKELKSLLKRAVSNSKKNTLSVQDFKEFHILPEKEMNGFDDLDLRKAIQNIEKQYILSANKKYDGNQVHMAKALGISRGSLQYKIKQMEQK